MPTYLRHLKLQFGGALGQGDLEIWSNTVHFKCSSDEASDQPSISFTPEQLDTALGLLNAPLQAWFNAADSQISSTAYLLWAKLNQIEPNGHQRDVNTHRIDTGRVAGAAAGSPPWYQTYALTMRTNLSRGRGHSGRIYPPLVGTDPEPLSPYAPPAAVNRMATSWALALNEISGQIHIARGVADVTPVFPVVASPVPTRIGDTGGALLEQITGVVVDRVPDVQTRRTNAIARAEGTRAAVTGYGT